MFETEVFVDAPDSAGGSLPGILAIPGAVSGLVIFAHGSGSSRLSPRNKQLAGALGRRGMATLLFDLLTPAEAAERENVFDIPLLARRLVGALEWSARMPQLASLPVGLFGGSTGAAAALLAAAEAPQRVGAVVSRGGRADMVAESLDRVQAPTLLIVGGEDTQVLDLNRMAFSRLTCEARLEIVPGATHLFEEPGALERVGELAGDWFAAHLSRAP
ncbi:dienelactone hydrolase family protein [Zhengella sp. ZM62]|uniref:dienelactone hydrolase family protein n=1 Tax=Zhengella sedimenti TaxID=3390035 RepID=UPI003977165A